MQGCTAIVKNRHIFVFSECFTPFKTDVFVDKPYYANSTDIKLIKWLSLRDWFVDKFIFPVKKIAPTTLNMFVVTRLTSALALNRFPTHIPKPICLKNTQWRS